MCPGDEHAAVDELTAVNKEAGASGTPLPLAPELALQPATPGRAVHQQVAPGGASRKRAQDGAEDTGASELSPGALSSPSSSESSAVGLTRPPPKRLRLRGKQAPPPEKASPPVSLLPERVPEEFVSRRVWQGMMEKAQYHYAYEKIRCFYVWKVYGERCLTAEERASWMAMGCYQKQKQAREAFKEVSTEDRHEYIRQWIQMSLPPPWLLKFLEQRFLSADGGKKSGTSCIKTQGVMLTWNLPADGSSDSSQIAQSLPSEQLTLDELVARLRTEPTAKALWGRVLDHGQRIKPLAGAEDVAVCLEVCPETYTLQKTLRLHIHIFLKTSAPRLRISNLSCFEFEGCTAHMSTQIGGLSHYTRSRGNWSGFFYCCLLEKKGTVFSEATKAPFTKFLVNPAWILSLVQASKLDIRPARELLVRCVNASRHVKELEIHEQELEKAAVKEALEQAQILLTQSLKKQKFYEKAQCFLRQFEKPLHRYKFLVLSGPSKVGKTAFARSLCELGKEVLEVNCASGDEPNLRAYRLRIHGLILFDEIIAGQVAQQRKLFQAQSAPVQLGCSATNCHSYDVFVWRKRLVLASNNWHTSLASLGEADQEWIHANSIVLDVEEAMWEA